MPTSLSDTASPTEQVKVVLFENVHQRAVEIFRAAGFLVEHYDRAYTGAELIEVAQGAHLIGLRSKTHLTAEFFERAKTLWGVGAFCIGTNQIDLAAAVAAGVPVFNEPFGNTRSVAELVISEIVALHRQLGDRSAMMHQGKWRKTSKDSHEIRGRVLGIVGYGRIGSQVSVLAESMGMRVMYHDVVDVLPLGNSQKADSLETLLAEADVVTLHVPATPLTAGMIGAEQIAQMKPGSFLINNARGNVVDVPALAAAIRSGQIAGAAVDVFPREPAQNVVDDFESPLQGLPNVILTPHVGGSTVEAQHAIAESVATRLVRLMTNGNTETAVNFPQVQLPGLHQAHHRLLHFHHNRPGVLARLHTICAELGVNVSAQYLQSDPNYAYLIMDVSAGQGEALRQRFREVPETIRVRTLW